MRLLRVTVDGQIVVLALAERGSFDVAGKCFHIGKSAVRNRVQILESNLGRRVFRAARKEMAPTGADNLYLRPAPESVRQALRGIDCVQSFLDARDNDLRMGYSSYLNPELLSSHITAALTQNQIISGVG
jgi:DNA-binding transcriptional LysR family regulator